MKDINIVNIPLDQVITLVRKEVEKVHQHYKEEKEDYLADLAKTYHRNGKLLTDKQASLLHFDGRVEPVTINKDYVKEGLKVYRFKGKYFYDPEDIDEFIRSNSRKAD